MSDKSVRVDMAIGIPSVAAIGRMPWSTAAKSQKRGRTDHRSIHKMLYLMLTSVSGRPDTVETVTSPLQSREGTLGAHSAKTGLSVRHGILGSVTPIRVQ